MQDTTSAAPSRRDFIRDASAAAVGVAAVTRWQGIAGAWAAGSDEIRVGLVGCGGRGTGARVSPVPVLALRPARREAR